MNTQRIVFITLITLLALTTVIAPITSCSGNTAKIIKPMVKHCTNNVWYNGQVSNQIQAILIVLCGSWYHHQLSCAHKEFKRMRYILTELETLDKQDALDASIFAERAQRQLRRSMLPLSALAILIAHSFLQQ